MKLKMIKTGTLVFAFSFAISQEKKKPNAEKKFKKIDTNDDGRIGLLEFKNKKGKKEVSEEKKEKRFAKIDTDSNGYISLKEFKKSKKKKGKKKKQE